ncbi:MAG: hypothetical protein ACP5JJ_19970, partial [Anaerolineae bacterium]
ETGLIPTPGEVEAPEPGLTPTPIELPVQIPTLLPGQVTGDVPQDLLAAILADAEARTGIRQEAFTVVRAEAVTWRDSSLGCPEKGMQYLQVLTPGYRIVLQGGDETLDYHASDTGYFVLCEEGLGEEGLPPGGGVGPEVDQ